eukprot:GHVS01081843.1.p1 GENE.GHVS01081843.1~~GHVS01081843.1.p1  ORF type:complete len:812 (+),score=210.01 GHVS01081843.1:347-2437(+)
MAVPQGMSYAMLAGLPVVYGLYNGLIFPLTYCLFGSSPFASVGVSAIEAMLCNDTVTDIIGHQAPVEFRVRVTVLLCTAVGIVNLALRVLGLSVVADFLSNPLLSGFSTASAFLIGTKQIGYLFAIPLNSDWCLEEWYQLISQIDKSNPFTLLIGVLSIAFLVLFRRLNRSFKVFKFFHLPGPLFVIAFFTALVSLTGLNNAPYHVRVLGVIPSKFPTPQLPFPVTIPSTTTTVDGKVEPYELPGGKDTSLYMLLLKEAVVLSLTYFIIHASIVKMICKLQNRKVASATAAAAAATPCDDSTTTTTTISTATTGATAAGGGGVSVAKQNQPPLTLPTFKKKLSDVVDGEEEEEVDETGWAGADVTKLASPSRPCKAAADDGQATTVGGGAGGAGGTLSSSLTTTPEDLMLGGAQQNRLEGELRRPSCTSPSGLSCNKQHSVTNSKKTTAYCCCCCGGGWNSRCGSGAPLQHKVDLDQDLVAMAIGQFVGSCFECFPQATSLSRSSVVYSIGASSPLHNVVASLLMALTLLLITPLLYYLPYAVLAAVVIVGVGGVTDFSMAVRLFKLGGLDFVVWLVSFTITLVFGVKWGIMASIALSLLWLLKKTCRPTTAVLGRLPGTTIYRNVMRFPMAVQIPGILIVRWDASLNFANVEYFEKMVLEHLEAADAVAQRRKSSTTTTSSSWACLVSDSGGGTR